MPQAAKENEYSYKGDKAAASAPPNDVTLKADFIPELGFSLVQTTSDPICSSANPECGVKKPKSHPVDYYVPNFGVDRDIMNTHDSIKHAEKRLGHELYSDWKKSDPHPQDYFVPNFGPDEDVANIKKLVANQESRLGHSWVPEQDDNGYWIVPEAADNKSYTYASLLQLGSDPICDSANRATCAGKKAKNPYPMDYFVPNFGLDKDILDTQKHVADQEKQKGHTWTPTQDENGHWDVPEAHSNKSYTYAAVQKRSDPICSSAGCTQYKHKKKELGYPINYPVPNNGRDKDDVVTTEHSLEVAEGQTNHKWDFEFSKDKPLNPAKKVLYDDKPALDSDVIHTRSHMKQAEGRLGAWTID